MFRIDTVGHVNNRFSAGNPQAGQAATRFGAEWPTAIQEEICRVIEAAGIPLDKLNNTQLYTAIIQIVAGVVGTGGGSVPTTRNVTGGGLATGGGPLAADLTLTVPKASAAEVLAGVSDTKAVTPLGLAAAFTRSLGSSGYITLPFGGGMIVQWLNATVAANNTTILNWPVSFPTAAWGALVNGGRSGFDSSDNPPFASGWGVSNVSVFNDINNTTSVFVLGIGN